MVSSGNGSQASPYVIENKHINATSLSFGIRIADVSSYFIIKNCIILGGNSGILLDNVWSSVGNLTNNFLINSTYGINLISTLNQRVEFNNFTGHNIGIRAENLSEEKNGNH